MLPTVNLCERVLESREKGPGIVTITELFGVLANPMSEFQDSLQLAGGREEIFLFWSPLPVSFRSRTSGNWRLETGP